MRKISLLFMLFVFVSLFSCKGENTLTAIQVAHKIIMVEIADTDELRAQGLMNRDSLEKERGMLFVFESERKLSFWMKDTYIPLSIAYISKSGEIKEIYDMNPLDETSVPSTRSVMYALEMNRGWFQENEIGIGDRVIIPENL